jgi:hypothetical protein
LNNERFRKQEAVSARKKTHHTKLSVYNEVHCTAAAAAAAAAGFTHKKSRRKKLDFHRWRPLRMAQMF